MSATTALHTAQTASADFRLADVVRRGDRVLVPQGCAEPLTLSAQLIETHRAVGPFECFIGPLYSTTFDGAAEAGMRFSSYGAMGRAGQLARQGLLDVWPIHYSALASGFASGALAADVVLLQLVRTPAGRLASVLANDYAVQAARRARCVVAEVNAEAPWCVGAELADDVRIDILVESARPPLEAPVSALGDAERAIARLVAGLVADGAVLQLGIGAMPDAILEMLQGHRDLGVHSGLIGDGVAKLTLAGVITNARKTVDAGVTVTNTAFGSRTLYRFIDGDPSVRLAPAAHTHAAHVIAGHPGMTAINSALEVDLQGNVNAEMMDGVPTGGTGGLVDFTRAARLAPGGQAIIALRATDRTGTHSRVKLSLPAVTVAKSDVDVIVTEYGVARLKSLGSAARAEALIALAAPQHREDLARRWRDGGR